MGLGLGGEGEGKSSWRPNSSPNPNPSKELSFFVFFLTTLPWRSRSQWLFMCPPSARPVPNLFGQSAHSCTRAFVVALVLLLLLLRILRILSPAPSDLQSSPSATASASSGAGEGEESVRRKRAMSRSWDSGSGWAGRGRGLFLPRFPVRDHVMSGGDGVSAWVIWTGENNKGLLLKREGKGERVRYVRTLERRGEERRWGLAEENKIELDWLL